VAFTLICLLILSVVLWQEQQAVKELLWRNEYDKGIICIKSGKFEIAERYLRNAVELSAQLDGTDYRRLASLNRLAEALQSEEKTNEAAEIKQKVMTLCGKPPDGWEALIEESESQIKKGNLHLAAFSAKKALKLALEAGQTLSSNCYAELVSSEKLALPVDSLRKANTLPTLTVAKSHLLLGKILLLQGAYAEAMETTKEALSIEEKLLDCYSEEIAKCLSQVGTHCCPLSLLRVLPKNVLQETNNSCFLCYSILVLRKEKLEKFQKPKKH
jgi:tetratricopeptide (TPR) repeat protein